jgi:hypothetical protein
MLGSIVPGVPVGGDQPGSIGLAVPIGLVVGDGLDMVGSRMQPMLNVRLSISISVISDTGILLIIYFNTPYNDGQF